MPEKRSPCPIAHVLDIVGDRWTLLVIRDIALFGKRAFGEMSASSEGIAPNTLSDRLGRLVDAGLITKEDVPGGPGRQYRYGLTKRGADLIPLLLDMIEWSATHDPDTQVTSAFKKDLKRNRAKMISKLQQPWIKT